MRTGRPIPRGHMQMAPLIANIRAAEMKVSLTVVSLAGIVRRRSADSPTPSTRGTDG
jgi:hypothetical protein